MVCVSYSAGNSRLIKDILKYSSGPAFIATILQNILKSDEWVVMILWDNEQFVHTSFRSRTWTLDAMTFDIVD